MAKKYQITALSGDTVLSKHPAKLDFEQATGFALAFSLGMLKFTPDPDWPPVTAFGVQECQDLDEQSMTG